MNFPLFIAKRIIYDKGGRQQVSRPAIRIATIGVAIGLAVMIITISVVLGFKHTVRDKVVGFGSHIQVFNVQGTIHPLCINDSTLAAYEQAEGVTHAERFVTTQGILKTEKDFLGVMFKGIGPEYDTYFLNDCLVEGELPALRARRFTISGIYQTHMKRFDDIICLTDLSVTQRLNGWDSEQCSGAELLVSDFNRLKLINSNVIGVLRDNTDRDGNMSVSYAITDIYPQVFSWLELLDINVWIILGLMIAVAGFTMISGLLIIILERTQMIGILKALGARNDTIRHTFLWFAAFIIGRGLLWGNILGIGLVVLQQTTGIVTLDAQTYYVSEAPMELNILFILLLNAATLLISVFVLIAPSYLVSHIHPARSMHYE